MLYVHTTILPDTPSIILRGTPAEASGQILSGRVMVRLGHSIKVKSAAITFQSATSPKSIAWRQTSIGSDILMKQELFSAADTPRGYETWAADDAGAREFPFSFAVPGNLHESVNTEFGHVCYELRVSIRTCGFGINSWTDSLRIPVYRVPEDGSPWAIALADSLQLQADWLGAVELEILSDAAAYSDKSKIQVRTIVRPLQKGQLLLDVGLRLREHIHCKTAVNKYGDFKDSEKVVCECSQKTCDPESGNLYTLPLQQEHSFDMSLDVPKAFNGIQFDMQTAQLRITHELMFFATILDKNQEPHYLSISAPVMVVPSAALESTDVELPAYRESNGDRLLLSSPPPASDAPRTRQTAAVQSVSLASLSLPPPSYQNICAAPPPSPPPHAGTRSSIFV
ncbi:hypothetical protein GQ54DRAFT_295768 [Martensiomyces pterosporus]|nr:hypothetical protein GQ54DRAFT_295768 [Martensiomyces pterosporus]